MRRRVRHSFLLDLTVTVPWPPRRLLTKSQWSLQLRPADVKAVLDRYAYYVKENLKKGYDIELLGFGKLFIRFITGKAVEDESKANAKLVKSLVPAFRPSFTKLQNGTRLYNLIPDSIELVKYGEEKKDKTTGGETTDGKNTGGETTGGETTGGGSGTEAGGTGSDNGDGLE